MDQEEIIITISVIIPAYNVSAYIERCIQSVMAQIRPCTECILVDDASTDNGIAKCERLIAGYQGPTRFVILHHKTNRGVSAARNTGFAAATSDYIFYLDSDDEMTPDCLEKLSAPLLQHESIEMVMGNYNLIADGHPLPDQKHKHLPEQDLATKEESRRYFFSHGEYPVVAWNKLLKRSFLEANRLFFIEGLLFEDNIWTFFMMKHLSHVYIVPSVTLLHYKRPSSITTGTDREKYVHHRALVYKEIVSHLTPGEEAREAAYYVSEFRSLFGINPKEPLLRQTLPLFKTALSDGHHKKALFYLFLAQHLTRTVTGQKLFMALRRIKKRLTAA